MTQTVTIAARFNGPPKSGNGGYTCGLAARFIDFNPVEVTLRAPPPLDTPLTVVENGIDVVLRNGETDVAVASLGELRLAPPPAPSRDAAERAAQSFIGHKRHIFPGCFVCGQHNPHGLHIYNGPVSDGLTAAPWTPGPDCAADDGRVASEYLWAALDCPTYWSLPNAGALAAVLGRLTVDITVRPWASENLIVAAWPLGSDGKKHRAASAIYDQHGGVLACAEALWIEVNPERFT